MSPEFITQITHVLANGNALVPNLAGQLRDAYPDITFTVCSDDDIPARLTPLANGEGFRLYGVSAAEHCATLTNNLEAASGLVIALTDDEE